MQDLIKTVADYMVKTGTLNTTSGNWIFTYDDLHEAYGINEVWFYETYLSMVEELYNHDAVSDVIFDGEAAAFDINFFLDFCPNADEAGEFEY